MSFEILITLAGVICTIVGCAFYLGQRIAKLDLKISIIWQFFVRRSVTEAVTKGAATLNSPLLLTPESRRWFDGLASDLHAIHAKLGPKATDQQLYMEIEMKLGDRIMHEICLQHGLNAGGCMALAAAVAREKV